ncbi:MAG: toll/interleukin-1 receptor domain-containing protein [Acidobacteriaceae bacterium]|nr:toll/interleukin-1 receptor domain-containing protein [Acidobacteriaceae bacterium]
MRATLRGTKMAHRRHWLKLAETVGVSSGDLIFPFWDRDVGRADSPYNSEQLNSRKPCRNPMPRIFISYRREDSSGYAGRLFDRLEDRFGRRNLFMDIDSLAPGVDFVEVINSNVSACDVLLAVIGKNWLTAKDDRGRPRLDSPEDFVRLEISAALKRGVRVIPVLVGGAQMPRSQELPQELAGLARLQAFVLYDDAFRVRTESLIEAIGKVVETRSGNRPLHPDDAPSEAERRPSGINVASVPEQNSVDLNARGDLYRLGQDVPQDYAEARKWYESAAAAGNAQAMNNLGWLYQKGHGVKQDYAQARRWYEEAVAGGNATAMNNLGMLYQNGYGVKQDYAQARQWYEKAVAGGNAMAMNNLGALYHNGHGVKEDYAQARQWYEKAVARGNAEAMNNLGWLYQNGHGVKQDYAQARQWFEKAVAGGNAMAMNNLGWLYHNGYGVKQDYAQARQWYEKAVAGGNANAMNNLGMLYYNGYGVKQDYAQARQWFEGALAGGNAEARANLKCLPR